MARNVLILATRHDAGTARTFQWAQDLRRRMYRYADNCLFIDVTSLCRAGTALTDLIGVSTHVVFYGHGENDRWIALPGKPPSPLIEVSTVSVLDNREVYAGCCWSLTGLGQAFRKNCTGHYIGYDNQFGFEVENESEFKNLVNQSVVNLLTSGNASQVVSELQQQWLQLSHAFSAGHLNSRPNAVMAGHVADLNSQRVGIA
jgi:hypothetical protein